MNDKTFEDPLLNFLYILIEDEEERKVLTMISKNFDEERIIEELINFTTEE